MKLMDQNGRLFGKVSIVDLLVAAVVIVLAIALQFKGRQTHTGVSVPQEQITYQILVRGLLDYEAEAIRVGDALFDKDNESGGALGEILSIESFSGTKLADRATDGTCEYLPARDCVDLLLTVRGEGLHTDDGRYLINRIYDLGVNSSRTYNTPYAMFVGTVDAIL